MSAPDKCPCCEADKIGYQATKGNRGCLVAFSCGSTCFFDENGVSIYHCGIPTRSERCWIREREDLHLRMRELEAKLAESVPRGVAERACAISRWLARITAYGINKDDSDEVRLQHALDYADDPAYPLNSEESMKDVAIALARAEAEAKARE